MVLVETVQSVDISEEAEGMTEFGTREYWEKELRRVNSRIQDVSMQIDSWLEDVGEMKSDRDELLKEYNEIQAELEDMDRREEQDLHEFRMKNDMVYHAMHTPSQKRLEVTV